MPKSTERAIENEIERCYDRYIQACASDDNARADYYSRRIDSLRTELSFME